MRDGDAEWLAYVNTWVELKSADGTFASTYERWILGKAAKAHRPRWSVIRDVLHWID